MMLITEKETCHEMMDRSVEATIKCLTLVKQAVGDYCFGWGIAADDSGTQRREFIRPQLWEEMIQPHYKTVRLDPCQHVVESVSAQLRVGLQPRAALHRGRDRYSQPGANLGGKHGPARLKQEFGDRLVFWGGGCDTQRVLGQARPEEIRRHVQERLEVFSPGGGYVFNQVHNIQANVPPENILAMFDAAHALGGY